jgi:site-specific DNA-cytosine methylase
MAANHRDDTSASDMECCPVAAAPKKKKRPQGLLDRQPTSSEEDLEQVAPPKKAPRPRVLKRPAKFAGHTNDDLDAAISACDLAEATRNVPKTSGVFDFIQWMVDIRLSDSERDTLKTKLANSDLKTGSMCAGMGTEEIVLKGLSLALGPYGVHLTHKSVFKAELDPAKLEFLKSTYKNEDTLYFQDNRDLQHEAATDADGNAVSGRPQVDALFCGIVCKDISPLSTTPKTERAEEGKSGGSLDGLLKYIRAMTLECRPKFLILECVERLSHKRSVDPDEREGTKYISDELSTLGYCGRWLRVNSKEWFLPQSRPRVYGLFLRLNPTDLSPKSRERRVSDLQGAVDLIERFKVPGPPEHLEAVLRRSRTICEVSEPKPERPKYKHDTDLSFTPTWKMSDIPDCLPKWRLEHHQFLENLGLTDEDVQEFPAFVRGLRDTLQPRAMEGLWLHLMHLKKKDNHDWTKGFCVASAGASIRFMSVRSDIFPCVTPKMNYCVLQDGCALKVRGVDILALQGVQNREVDAFKLNALKSAFLQELAGNAFTSNIFAAFFVAGCLAA